MINFMDFNAILQQIKDGTVTIIDLNFELIGDERVIVLAGELKVNKTLTDINLTNNNIGLPGAIAIAEALRVNETLTRINLSENNIGLKGAIAIAEALKVNKTIKHINLSFANIEIEGVIALVDALKVNKNLTDINLSFNDIGPKGAIDLAEALWCGGNALTHIDLSGNDIGDHGAVTLIKMMKRNPTITDINLSYNKITEKGAIGLAKKLVAGGNALTHIDLSCNRLRAKGVIALIKELEDNKTLTHIDLSRNMIGTDGVIALVEALKDNKSMMNITIGGTGDSEQLIFDTLISINQGKTIDDKVLSDKLLTLARYHSDSDDTTVVEVIEHLLNLTNEEGSPLIDINGQMTDGSTILTYYRDKPKMLDFLMSHGAKYPLTEGTKEVKIAKNAQSTHGSKFANQHSAKLLELGRKFVKLDKPVELDDPYKEVQWLKQLIQKLRDAYISEKDQIVEIEVPASQRLKITIDKKAHDLLSEVKKQLLREKFKAENSDYENKSEAEKAQLVHLINNDFFNRAKEGLDIALERQDKCTLGPYADVSLKEVAALVYKAFIIIAKKEQDMSGLLSNFLHCIAEIVDFSTTYSTNLTKENYYSAMSCSRGTITKLLGAIDSKDSTLTVPDKVPVAKSLFGIKDIKPEQQQEYATQAWQSLDPKVRKCIIDDYAFKTNGTSINHFRGALYTTLNNIFADKVTAKDIAKAQLLFIHPNPKTDGVLPKELFMDFIWFDLFNSEHPSVTSLTQKQSEELQQDQDHHNPLDQVPLSGHNDFDDAAI
jgi:Ran GTPase-activating protein (RanGAP) involved in mRNA processing and transport